MKLYSSLSEAETALKIAVANDRKGRAFVISKTENGWWKIDASKPMRVTQSVAGKLCVNGKPVSELIQGLFSQCTDRLDAFTFPNQRRFFGLMDEHGKASEARHILKFAIQP